MPNAPSKRTKQSRGNAVALLLCHSEYAEYRQVPETMFAALGHFGIPYRVRDLSAGRLRAAELENCAVLVIGQENLGIALSASDQRTILQAVADGLGLVNFDYNLAHYDDSFLDVLGLKGTRHDKGVGTIGAANIGIVSNSDNLTWTQEAGRVHSLAFPIPAAVVRAGKRTTVLAETEHGYPAVIRTAAGTGSGQVIQWLVSPRIWTLQVFGHAHGLDDLFWKGIVLAARKPFAMHCIPPFIRFRFDDCNGLYRTDKDMAFVNVLNKYGHKPNMCVSMNALKTSGWRMLKSLHDSDKVEVAPHTWRGGVSLYYGVNGKEYTKTQFRELITATAALMKKHGIKPSKILSDHEHECSARVLPFLDRLGIEYKMNVMVPGENWVGPHVDWRPAPYGSMSYALDYTPGPYPLFVVFNHYPAFDFARSYLSPRSFLLNRAGGYGDDNWDFLNGLTDRDQPKNNIEKMARRLAEHTRLGLNSLFFGGSISHSHFTQSLSLEEWKAILDRYERLTARLEKINVGYDDIAMYAKGKFHTHLAAADRVGSEGMDLSLSGKSEVPLKISVFKDRGGSLERSYVETGKFSGKRKLQV